MDGEIFRCRSMTEEVFYHIEVPRVGHITCSCQGVNWCSHIEATLICSERAMVHPADIAAADRAQMLARGRLDEPKHWKANWRSNRRWRGLPVREAKALNLLRKGIPVVSLEGRGAKRVRAEALARENGWQTVYAPTKGVLVHVSDAANDDPRCQRARELGIATVTHDHWPQIAPFAEDFRKHVAALSKSAISS